MDLTGIIFAAFFFGIGVLFMGFLSFLPYIKDRSDVRKKNYKVYKVVKKEQIKAPDYMEIKGREDTYYGYTLEDEQGQQVYFESIWDFYKEGKVYKMKKDGNEYSTVGNMGNPGILSYLAMFYGGMLVLIGIVLIFRESWNIPSQFIVKVFMILALVPAYVGTSVMMIDNYKTCQKKNLVIAKVDSYRWKDYYSQSSNSGEAIEHVLVLYISYMKDGVMYTEPVQKVAENGLIKKKYPVNSDIQVYINPDGDYAVQNGTNNNIILKNRRFRGYLLGIFLMTAAIAISLIILFVYKDV